MLPLLPSHADLVPFVETSLSQVTGPLIHGIRPEKLALLGLSRTSNLLEDIMRSYLAMVRGGITSPAKWASDCQTARWPPKDPLADQLIKQTPIFTRGV